MSDSSDEEKIDGNTTPHGPARWQLQGYLYPEECKSTGQWSPVNRPPVNQPPAICPMDKKTFQNSQSPATGHRPPVKWALHKNFQVSQSPVTGHPATGHWT